jgi:pectate lyase
MKLNRIYVLAGLIGSLLSAAAIAVPRAFPGAEGAGCYATGGRGGEVYEVTTLSNSGVGSIVDAVSTGHRTIVFRVSGTIELGDVLLRPKSNTTIAGQTAPGDGICLKGRLYIGDVSDVIIRYLRVRVDAGGANSSGDAIDIAGGNRVIIDHVSASYARDETISCQNGSNHITVQWCILSEALTYEGHSYGSLIRGEYGEQKSYHHNLYAHNRGRNPRPGNYTLTSIDPEGLHFDFRNNVVYNWAGSQPGYNADTTTTSRYNFVGNVFIAGPESTVTNQAFKEDAKAAYAYWRGNAYGSSYATVFIPPDQWSLVKFNGFTTSEITAYKARSYELPMEAVTTTTAQQAMADVLGTAGASFPARDIIDSRIVNDVIKDTGHSIATTDEQPEGAWPTLYSEAAPTDSDHDGMPDTWEYVQGLNPYASADRNYYTLDPEYTNLEVYLNRILSGNQTPTADAGSDQVVWLGMSGIAGQEVITLAGMTSDDGPYSILWTQVDTGAPAVTIRPDDADIASVTIRERGRYEFKLTADDGSEQAFDTVSVIAGTDACDASHLFTGQPYDLGDQNQDCLVDLTDLMMLFADDWLVCTDTLTDCAGG